MGAIVFFEILQAGIRSSLQYKKCSTPEWSSDKCIYETLRQLFIWTIVLRLPLSPIGLLFNESFEKIFGLHLIGSGLHEQYYVYIYEIIRMFININM